MVLEVKFCSVIVAESFQHAIQNVSSITIIIPVPFQGAISGRY